jgi:molybdopterin/thiamine biosynthesis adenylyltransferase
MQQLFRTEGVLDLNKVRQQIVVFLGLGSLGSLTLSNMAYPFKQIVLIDPDDLEEDNVERHLLGYSDITDPPTAKVVGIKRWLIKERRVDPNSIVIHKGNAQDFLHLYKDADLLVVNIDKRQVRDEINQFAVEHNIPAVYGGIYSKGIGGRVMVLPSPKDVCYQCAEYVMGNTYEGHIGADYGVDPDAIAHAEDLHAVPALKPSIAAVAGLMAFLAMDLLGGGDKTPKVVVEALASKDLPVFLKTKSLSSVAGFIREHEALGLIPSMKIVPQPGSRFKLYAERDMFTFWVRQEHCPLHGGSESLENV